MPVIFPDHINTLLETCYQAQSQRSYTELSIPERETICSKVRRVIHEADEEKGSRKEDWEWMEGEKVGKGQERLRTWWRLRNTKKSAKSSARGILRDSLKRNTIPLEKSKSSTPLSKAPLLIKNAEPSISSLSTSSTLIENEPFMSPGLLLGGMEVFEVEPECESTPFPEEEVNSMKVDLDSMSSTHRAEQELFMNEFEEEVESTGFEGEKDRHRIKSGAIGESEVIIFLEARQLRIGTWMRRLNYDRPELMAYYSPGEKGFAFWTTHDSLFYRFILPLASVDSLKVFQSTSQNRILLIFTRSTDFDSQPLRFSMCSPDVQSPDEALTWFKTPRGDWTEGYQASVSQTYSLEIEGIEQFDKFLDDLLCTVTEREGKKVMRKFLRNIWWGEWWEDEYDQPDLIRIVERNRGWRGMKDQAEIIQLDTGRFGDGIVMKNVFSTWKRDAVVLTSSPDPQYVDLPDRIHFADSASPYLYPTSHYYDKASNHQAHSYPSASLPTYRPSQTFDSSPTPALTHSYSLAETPSYNAYEALFGFDPQQDSSLYQRSIYSAPAPRARSIPNVNFNTPYSETFAPPHRSLEIPNSMMNPGQPTTSLFTRNFSSELQPRVELETEDCRGQQEPPSSLLYDTYLYEHPITYPINSYHY